MSFGFSFIEIYNENIRDLLTAETRKSSAISEDSKGNVILIDVQEIPI